MDFIWPVLAIVGSIGSSYSYHNPGNFKFAYAAFFMLILWIASVVMTFITLGLWWGIGILVGSLYVTIMARKQPTP